MVEQPVCESTEMERLVESDSLEHDNGTAGYLLFTTDSGIFPFVM